LPKFRSELPNLRLIATEIDWDNAAVAGGIPEGTMRKTVLLAVLPIVVLLLPSDSFARDAGECLAAPNGASPRGSHWYYRLDRTTRRKCWYLGPQGRKTNSTSSHVATDERREAPPTAAPAATPVAPTPVVRQTEPDLLSETKVGGAVPKEALSPIPLDQLKVPAPMDSVATVNSAPASDAAAAADSQDTTSGVAPDTAPVQAAVDEQPAAAPAPATAPDTGMPWGYLVILLMGALAAAGFLGRAMFRPAGALRLDQYAGRTQTLASVLRAWTARERDHALPDRAPAADAMSSPSPVPYLHAPNLAWRADEGSQQSDEPRWTEAPDDMHAEPWMQRDLRRTRIG
jgi:hypothetical protein